MGKDKQTGNKYGKHFNETNYVKYVKKSEPKRNLTVIKRSNKLVQALHLPTIANINPQSVYNKVEELETFVKQESVDLLFLSESWERENKTLPDLIKLNDHEVISNVYQRIGVGGRPAVIANNKKYHIQNMRHNRHVRR